MRKKLLICLMGGLWPFVYLLAQPERINTSPSGLQIGDTIPDILIENIINYPTTRASVSSFSGKLLLIDFWATTCGPCAKNLPKLNALKQKYSDKLEILLVSSSSNDDPERVDAFFKRREANGLYNSLPYILGDTAHDCPVLERLFPHQIISHYAWIGPDGVVKAITSAEHVTEANLLAVLAGKDIHVKERIFINADQPLFTVDALPEDDLAHFSIFIRGHYDGLPSGNRYRRKNGIVYGRALTNATLLGLYKAAAAGMYPDFRRERVVFEFKDTSELVYDSTEYSTKSRWFKENCFTYELSVPFPEADSLYSYMFQDLNRYSEYTGTIEKVSAPVYVLTSEREKSSGTTESCENHGKYKAFLRRIEEQLYTSPLTGRPVIDETGYYGSLPDKLLSCKFKSREDLKISLARHGLKLIPSKRPLTTLILSKKK